MSTSDQIRKIIQLKIKPAKRPRLTVSLTPEDYQQLAERYGIAAEDRDSIREAVKNELMAFSKQLKPD